MPKCPGRAVQGVWKVMAKGYVVSFGSNENALKLIMVGVFTP